MSYAGTCYFIDNDNKLYTVGQNNLGQCLLDDNTDRDYGTYGLTQVGVDADWSGIYFSYPEITNPLFGGLTTLSYPIHTIPPELDSFEQFKEYGCGPLLRKLDGTFYYGSWGNGPILGQPFNSGYSYVQASNLPTGCYVSGELMSIFTYLVISQRRKVYNILVISSL